jgi:hypothetical protein
VTVGQSPREKPVSDALLYWTRSIAATLTDTKDAPLTTACAIMALTVSVRRHERLFLV